METGPLNSFNSSKQNNLMVHNRWPWHLLFWIGYSLTRFWAYYLTVTNSYPKVFLEYMLLSETLFVATTYFTLWLYRRLFEKKKYTIYFLVGTASWLVYLYGKTAFQSFYFRNLPNFKQGSLADILISNVTYLLVCFLFITACKYFKDGYIAQQFEAERKQQQLLAEVNNLKSQIAPHFLFNTLNNLYGLAVEKSDKLPNLMLRLSDLLRHSLYETEKPLVPLDEEIKVLKSYVELESLRLEDDLKLEFDNEVPKDCPYLIAPLILIVFIENAFKHAKLIKSGAVNIYIRTYLENDWFIFSIKNNYNKDKENSTNGIGLTNVKRRLEVLYPNHQHHLKITQNETFYSVNLELQLVKDRTNNT